MAKLFITLLWLSILAHTVCGQGDYNNMRKYWYYKTRLTNCFTKVGTGRGESMPFNQRGYTTKKLSVGGNTNDIVFAKTMNIGDGTSTLGYYIGMLATEYYLLKQNGQRTDSVRHELFCALNAFNRLDAFAESSDASNINTPTPLNGFFIRDDIPKNFVINNYDHFNYYNNWSGATFGAGNWDASSATPASINTDIGFGSLIHSGQMEVFSSWEKFESLLVNGSWTDPLSGDVSILQTPIADHVYKKSNGDPDIFGTTFASQDQIYNLLFGLALASKFVDDTARDYHANGSPIVFPYEYNGQVTSIRDEARYISDRIIRRLQDEGWSIIYPGSTHMVYGGNADVFAYPLAEAGCFISGEGELPANSVTGSFISPKACGGAISNNNETYHNLYSGSIIAFETWNSIAKTEATKMDVAVFKANLSAITNGIYGVSGGNIITSTISHWEHVPVLNWLGILLKWIWRLVTAVLSVFIDFDFANSTGSSMTDNAYAWDLDHATVARKILHPNVGNYIANGNHSMDYLLDLGPCQGTFNFGNGYRPDFNWSSDTRLDHTERMGINENSEEISFFSGEYNGIDYMLYHNLWGIYKMQQNGSYYMADYSDMNVDLHGNALNLNPSTNTFSIHGYETVSVDNTIIPNNANGEIRAGKTLHFGPGMQFTGVSNVHIYIEPWGCATDYSAGRLANPESEDPHVKWQDIEYVPEPVAIKNTPVRQPGNSEAVNNTLVFEEQPSQAYLDSIALMYMNGNEIRIVNDMESSISKVYFILQEGEFANITVVDMKGQMVFESLNIQQKNNGVAIDMSSFTSGLYILKFIRSNGKEESKKLYKL